MLILITGGSGSGKSELAEKIAVSLGGRMTYIAAMKPRGDEAETKIARHRRMRDGKGFETIERYTGVKNLKVSGTVLLECMSNLLANEMFSDEGCGKEAAETEIMLGIHALERQCKSIVIVTNEVSSDGNDYGAVTEQYMKSLGRINCAVAQRADEVYESVCGVAVRIK